MARKKRYVFCGSFFIIIILNLFTSTMVQMFNATIALHIEVMGYTTFISGTLISIGAVTATAYRFFGGWICEIKGRRQLIIFGTICFGTMSFLMGRIKLLPLLYVVRLVQMFGYAMVATTLSVAAVDSVPQDRMGQGLGIFGLATSAAQAFGPSIALALYGMKAGFPMVMNGAAMIGAISFIIAAMFGSLGQAVEQPETGTRNSAAKKEGIWKYVEERALPAAIINFFLVFSNAAITMFLTLYASREGIGSAGLFFTISVVCILLTRLIAGNISDKYGVLVALAPGIILLIVCYLLLIWSRQSHILYYLAGVFFGLGNGLATPALNAEAIRMAPKDRTSVASSTFYLPLDLAYLIGSVLWGIVIERIDFLGVFVVAAGLIAAALVMSLFAFARNGKVIRCRKL